MCVTTEPAKAGKCKDEANDSEHAERLKRQKQAQLEARMANPDCLRNSSCQRGSNSQRQLDFRRCFFVFF